VLAISILLISMSSYVSATDFPECEGLNGPALGLCKAGTSIGCLGDELDPPACGHISSSYQSITGESPYWAVQCDECPAFPLGNFESVVVPNSCQPSGVVACEVTRCNYQGAGVQVGDQFWSFQDATYNGGPYTSFNDACR